MSLTERQRAILEFVRDYRDAKGYSPSVRDIGMWFGMSVAGVRKHLAALEAKGAIRREPHTARSIIVVAKR